MPHLTQGLPLHLDNLVTLVSHETKLGEYIVRHLLGNGFAGVERNGLYFQIRAEHRLYLTVFSQLPELVRTPAGNLRTGSLELVSGIT